MIENDIKIFNIDSRHNLLLFDIKNMILKDSCLLSYILENYIVSEEFIRKCILMYGKSKDFANWNQVSKNNLSEDFIREFKDDINWETISQCQKLSEAFIREFKDRVEWGKIFIYQELSENFIREFKSEIRNIYVWGYISKCQILSKEFILEFKDKFSNDILKTGVNRKFAYLIEKKIVDDIPF